MTGGFEAHGAINPGELRRLGIDPADVLDFSTNCNPFGCPPAVNEALGRLSVCGYPDPEASALRDRLAQLNGCRSRALMIGNGAAELIWCLARAFAGPDRAVMQLGPSFGEYRAAAQSVGAPVIDYRLQPPDFSLDVARFCAHILRERPALLFVCQPNNPTGRLLDDLTLDRIAATCRDAGTRLVLDQAYLWFAGQQPFGGALPAHVIALRSLTKDLGIAGLRLGYLLAEPTVVEVIKAHQPPWTVNSAAQDCGLVALDCLDWVDETVRRSRALAADLIADLRSGGWTVENTETHFALIRVGNAALVRRELLFEHRIQVRNCQSFGLPEYIRVAAQTQHRNAALLEAMATLKASA